MLAPVALETKAERLFDAEKYPSFGTARLAGDLHLRDQGSVHMRYMLTGSQTQTDSRIQAVFEQVVSDLAPLLDTDIFLVHIGAHYINDGVEKYIEAIKEVINNCLVTLPGDIYWREYAPSHFGGETGKYNALNFPTTCAPADRGERYLNEVTQVLLTECGEACAHIKWVPIFAPTLQRHASHTGDHINKTKMGDWAKNLDCRHYCLNVIDVWNIIFLHMACGESTRQA